MQASKPDVSGQPSTFGVKEGEIGMRPQKVHGRAYSREWNLIQNILSLMCLGNIHNFGHLREPTRLKLICGTSSEPSPQYEQLRQNFERSQNYQTGC
ncbi:hypothetical protein ACS0TY_011712 [Phlomoides rotata]